MIRGKSKLRVIVLTHGYAESLIDNLLKLDGVEVVGVFIETEVNRRAFGLREKMRRSIRYDGYLATVMKGVRMLLGDNESTAGVTNQILENQQALGEFAGRLNVPAYFLSNYHTDESVALMRATEADLGVIWGTNILKESVFNIPRLGSINIHQGLAPYYRGGPSVFWELYNGEPEVGITVHFVEPTVDTGKILAQKTLPLNYDFSYGLNYDAFITEYRARMRSHCTQLMTDAVRMIGDGTAQPRLQDISLGTRYRLPIKREKDEMRRRLRQRWREMDSHSRIGPRPHSQTGTNVSQ